MMVLWEKKQVSVKELGNELYLDSGTLTPLLKKLEKQELITRTRSDKDERNLIITLTAKGEQLRSKALQIPLEMGQCLKLSNEETMTLYKLLYKLIEQI